MDAGVAASECLSPTLSKPAAAESLRNFFDSDTNSYETYTLKSFEQNSGTGQKRADVYRHYRRLVLSNTRRECGYVVCKYLGRNGCRILDGAGGAVRALNTSQGTSAMIYQVES